jgi:hypothetical protein
MWDRSDFYIRGVFGSLYFTERVLRAHAAVTNAIRLADADTAESITSDYLTETGISTVRWLRRREQHPHEDVRAPAQPPRRPGIEHE